MLCHFHHVWVVLKLLDMASAFSPLPAVGEMHRTLYHSEWISNVPGAGESLNVTIARDLQGKPRGFAHVEFSNELESQNALSLHGEAP